MIAYSATLSVTIPVQASARNVFSSLTNWSAQSEWMVGTKVHATKHGGIGIGGEISAFTGIGIFGFTDTMVITAWDPPRLCSVEHTGSVVKGTGDFIVAPVSSSKSLFTWSEEFILPFGILGKIGWPVARPFVRFGLRVSLKKFAIWAESQR